MMVRKYLYCSHVFIILLAAASTIWRTAHCGFAAWRWYWTRTYGSREGSISVSGNSIQWWLICVFHVFWGMPFVEHEHWYFTVFKDDECENVVLVVLTLCFYFFTTWKLLDQLWYWFIKKWFSMFENFVIENLC